MIVRLVSGLPLAVLLLFSAPALGATLMTPHLYSGANFVACTITNYSDSPITVRIDEITYDGTVFTKTLDVEPLLTQTHTFSGAPPESYSCRFTFDGPKRQIRAAALEIDHLTGVTITALPAT